jgi:hypothetical protein
MNLLIAAAALVFAAAAPALACEWNQSAGADSQSTVASQSTGAQQKQANAPTQALLASAANHPGHDIRTPAEARKP